jgi:hypothetical protein
MRTVAAFGPLSPKEVHFWLPGTLSLRGKIALFFMHCPYHLCVLSLIIKIPTLVGAICCECFV